jgi:hypothetical protein
VKALIVANEYLEAEVQELQAAVSSGYARGYKYGRFKTMPAKLESGHGRSHILRCSAIRRR